ncbi:hypothetical protein TUM4249_31390 [Shewanella sp. KT0246]|nr:hypothetical protein TUM4249_31390 [Shewanella sp. KT0246]
MNITPVIASMILLPLLILFCIAGLVSIKAKKQNQISDKINNKLAEAILVDAVTSGVTSTVNIVIKKISALGLSKLVYKPILKPLAGVIASKLILALAEGVCSTSEGSDLF